MQRVLYRDLLLLFLLALLSLVTLMIPALNLYPLTAPLIYIPYILLFIFLPGYALMAARDPLFTEESLVKRIGLSVVVSLIISALLVLVFTYTPFKSYYNTIAYILIIFTIFLGYLAYMKRKEHYYLNLIESEGEKKEIPDKRDGTERKEGSGEPVKKFFYYDLLLVFFLTILSMAFLLLLGLKDSYLKGFIGLFLVLILPGYALTAILYPVKDDLDGIQRLVLSFSFSYALTVIVGLILNFSFSRSLNDILLVLSVLSLILIICAFFTRKRIPGEDRYWIDFTTSFNNLNQRTSRSVKFASVAVIVILVLFVSAPAYNTIFNSTGNNSTVKPAGFTEFYVLSPDGHNITSYPDNLTYGKNGTVKIVLVNHENTTTSYQIITTSNKTVMDVINVTLNSNEKKEIDYNFTAGKAGNKTLEFLLFKLPDLNNVYHSQSFWLNII